MMLARKKKLLNMAEAAFRANAVDFDGTNDYLTRGGDLTGSKNGRQGTLSVWLRLDGGDGANLFFLANGTGIQFRRSSANKMAFNLDNASGGALVRFTSNDAFTASATWMHILLSWNVNFSIGNKIIRLYVNDASAAVTVGSEFAAADIGYAESSWTVGAAAAANNPFNGAISELWFDQSTYLDFSVEANRRKFIGADGKPVRLGADGSLPTGSAPILYLNNPAASFGINKGTGGSFSVTGSLDDASTSPSD